MCIFLVFVFNLHLPTQQSLVCTSKAVGVSETVRFTECVHSQSFKQAAWDSLIRRMPTGLPCFKVGEEEIWSCTFIKTGQDKKECCYCGSCAVTTSDQGQNQFAEISIFWNKPEEKWSHNILNHLFWLAAGDKACLLWRSLILIYWSTL